ncbi:MAG TPA: TonB-dependent receptor [Paludibacter sp.]|nr:TonB-dependent receptor [Paludibacter sp.]
MKKILFILFCISSIGISLAKVPAGLQTELKGRITDQKGEPLAGATIYIPELKTGTVTDIDGYYVLDNLPKRNLLVQVNIVGYKMIVRNIDLKKTSQQNFQLEETIVEINEIVVTGQSGSIQLSKLPAPISMVSSTDLRQQATTNIIDALGSQPGVSEITTGNGISKPVIRGLGYNRVVVLNDGIRQEGQQWGDEHGIEVDEFDVDRVELLKGPASLLYGSDAMAGVINLLPAALPAKGKLRLNTEADYQTNGGLRAYSLNFAGHKKYFVWDTRYSNKAAHAYRNKFDGPVYNSGFNESSLSALIGTNHWWGYSHLNLSLYNLTPGIVEGERDSLTGAFLKPVFINGSDGYAAATSKDFTSYTQLVPYQQVGHSKIVWNTNMLLGEGSLKTIVGYQQNRRKEFDNVQLPDKYGLYFKLNTLNYNILYTLPEINGFGVSTGVNGMYQHSLNEGTEYLVPEYALFDAGVFVIGKKSFGKLDVNGGLRYDHRAEQVDALYLDENDVKTTVSNPNATIRFAGFDRSFEGISGSLGGSCQFDERWNAKLNFSRGFRAPNISELASNGVHEGTLRYEIGASSLKAETSLQTDIELGYNTKHISAKLNLFSNTINNYIYSRKLNNAGGGDSITAGVMTFQFESGKARLAGGELQIDIHPHPLDWLHIENSFSYVDAQLLHQADSTRYLPFTPPAKWISSLRADIVPLGKFMKNAFFHVELARYFRQDKIFNAYHTETATPGYTLLGAGLGTDIVARKRTICTVYVNGTNLADVAYQSHLSRLKYAPANYATGRNGIYNMGRNVSLKVVVPVEW